MTATVAYDWRIAVMVVGTRNGWVSRLIDTPTFELRSNAQFGGMWSSPESVARVARDMFSGLARGGDDIHVSVSSIDGTQSLSTSFKMETVR